MARALVLSGGGAKGAFELGALDCLLKEKKLNFDIICGTSVGALNGTLVAQDDFDSLKNLWFSIKKNSDIYTWKPFWFLRLPWIKGFFNFSPLKKLINKYCCPDKILKVGKKLRVGVVSLQKNEVFYIPEDHPSLKEMVFASACMPFFADPIELGYQFVDGGVIDVTPLKPAIELGATEIYVILASPMKKSLEDKKFKNIVDISLRSFEIMMTELYRNDVLHALEINSVIKTFGTYNNYRYIPIHIIEPDYSVSGTLEFNPEKIRRAYDHGYQKAKEAI